MAQRQQDASSVFFAFPLNGKIYESKLAVASIISAPGWIPSEPSAFPAHKAVEAAAPVARSAAGSLGSWRVSGIRLYSLGPPRTQSWYYGVTFQPRDADRSNDAVVIAVDFAGRVGSTTVPRTQVPSFAPNAWTFPFDTSTNTAGIGFASWFDGNCYESELSSRRIRAAPEWVLPQPSPFSPEKAVQAAFPLVHSLVGDVDGWYISGIRFYSLPQRPESWCYCVAFRQEGQKAMERSVNIGVDFAGRVGTMSTNRIRNVVSSSN